jgi:prevent-host-death family protein
MQTWQLQEAKSHFSELVERTLAEGPQLITRRGAEAVVIIPASEFRRMHSGLSLQEVLRNAPRGEPLALERSAEPVREMAL